MGGGVAARELEHHVAADYNAIINRKEEQMASVGHSVSLISDFADFLATSPEPRAILDWHPSESVEMQLEKLLAAQQSRTLSEAEQNELESFRETDILLQLLKARLRSTVQ